MDFYLILPLVLLLAVAFPDYLDRIDEVVRFQMERRKIPGLSLAIIDEGKIVKAQGYGSVDKDGKEPITPSTLFQAGSISKPVAAYGALLLAEAGKLSLDEDVNAKLKTWKVPQNDLTKTEKVTLHRLLSHTAGLPVSHFPGYPAGETPPTLVQILEGEKPANTDAIRVDLLPGSQFRYSGGGYIVMQQLMIDVTGESFPRAMEEAVLRPLGMNESTYEQPLSEDRAKQAASAYYSDGRPVHGRWNVYPEMAAAGLWTTPSDLARFVLAIQAALAGRLRKGLSPDATSRMVTPHKENMGLGLYLDGEGTSKRFGHGGRDAGFDARLAAYAEAGRGAIVMLNANDDSQMVSQILEAIADEYGWPDYPRPPVYRPIEDREPEMTERSREVLQSFQDGRAEEKAFTPERWASLSSHLNAIRGDLQRNGPLQSLVLVERNDEGEDRIYRYRAVFEKGSGFIFKCRFDKANRLTDLDLIEE